MIKPTTVLGQPAMWLRAPDGAEVTVLLHGGQIVSWIPAGDQERLYSVFLPTDYDGQRSYPVVLFLHGSGERGDDNRAQLKHFAGATAARESVTGAASDSEALVAFWIARSSRSHSSVFWKSRASLRSSMRQSISRGRRSFIPPFYARLGRPGVKAPAGS